ncbi:MAG: hypothetical protein HY317_06395 [Acidobacteria bacterium]|nr:hypothetical protein [Acidobacteriota bacterium]
MPRPLRAVTPHTLVIDRAKAELLPVLRDLLSPVPDIRVVIDRRRGERRGSDRRRPRVLARGSDRRKHERRQASVLYLA